MDFESTGGLGTGEKAWGGRPNKINTVLFFLKSADFFLKDTN
jgi:hypothetical protein